MLTIRSHNACATRALNSAVESKPPTHPRLARRVATVQCGISGALGLSRPVAAISCKARRQPANLVARSSADDEVIVVDPDSKELKKSAGFLRSLSFLSFWSQLALSMVSGGILFFSVMINKQPGDFAKWAGLVGVILGFLSTFFAHGFNSIAKKLNRDEKVSRRWIVNTLITNNTLNLVGIMSAIIGLQASIGTLVAKSLMTPNGVFTAPAPGSTLASIDIFALQALGNILLSHFISLAFTNLLLRAVNKPATQAA